MMRPLKNALFRPIYIPLVKILTRLDLDQISANFEIEHF